MKENLKKLAKYYKPYLGTFILDMILAMMSAAVALVIPLVVRFITSKVAYMSANEALSRIMIIVGVLFVLVLIQWGCNYYISNYGHVMGAKIEYDMRRCLPICRAVSATSLNRQCNFNGLDYGYIFY